MAHKKIQKDEHKVEKAKKSKKDGRPRPEKTKQKRLGLLASDKAVDPALSSLFAPTPVIESVVGGLDGRESVRQTQPDTGDADLERDALGLDEDGRSAVETDAGDGLAPAKTATRDRATSAALNDSSAEVTALNDSPAEVTAGKRSRKRKDRGDDLEDDYMRRLAREEAKETADRSSKRNKVAPLSAETHAELTTTRASNDADMVINRDDGKAGGVGASDEDDQDAASPPPKHETQLTADTELDKAARTVFLGNVSTSAITSKPARKTLIQHLGSFFDDLPPGPHKIESLRFRSTAFASALPKKAAFATKALMDATTKSTNAYAVYSAAALARAAAQRLNGTVILNRHLRVDSVAHPSAVDHRRCVFVGNLGFVDDERNIDAGNAAAAGREQRTRGKEPADVEEGLWRAFARCGRVESVRVVRDSRSRVGKGIAYVQFHHADCVEQALLLGEKKFPPMLPRKLRVVRAKAVKRSAKPVSGRPAQREGKGGYVKKVSGEEASRAGRAGRLLGRAGAAQMRRPPRAEERASGDARKGPESFVFEGHRASSRQGKSGLKLGGSGARKSAKPRTRSARRGAAFKAGGKKGS